MSGVYARRGTATRRTALSALEAVRVRPYAQGGEHALVNGLLLRADIHRLYDTGCVTVTPDHHFRVSGDLFDDFHNGREYERFARREIAMPKARAERPDAELPTIGTMQEVHSATRGGGVSRVTTLPFLHLVP